MQAYTLQLQPQSGRTLAPRQQRGIEQRMQLLGVERGRGDAVKMRWKCSYRLAGEVREEQGEIGSLGVA